MAKTTESKRKNVGLINHPLFPGKTCTAKARLMMAEKLGRELQTNEHVHHKDDDKSHDVMDNLELLPSKDHHQLHKLGVKRPEVAEKLKGRKHTSEAIARMQNLTEEQRQNRSRAGKISGNKPKPWLRGKPLSEETKAKIRQAALERYERKQNDR